jgi:hypothetical protein
MHRFLSLALALALTNVAFAQNDPDYAAKIKEYTTDPHFLTEYVDHLPLSATVPSPLKYFGHIIGEPNILHHTDEINGYMRALDAASDRVIVKSMGKSEEGREMIAVFISDADNLKNLDEIASINAQLSDPRKLVEGGYKGDGKLTGADEKADALIKQTLPIYYATGGMHSPESGPPEMLMELAYRLATEETPYIQEIRKNSVVMLTPVLETDGRDRFVDTYYYRKQNPKKPPVPLIYWGHYVAHDDNRDNIGMQLQLSKNLMNTWMQYHPIVLHDLHESVPFLYISTGTGPYNAWLDPITIDEWQMFAYDEIDEMTKRGVPGVWTHGFYDGWAPNYAFYIANGHNAIGRFYEIQGGSGADTRVVNTGDASQRDWFRPNPPLSKINWSIRNNTNISESALIVGMHHLAADKDKFLHNYWLKCKRSVEKPWTEGPAAYVVNYDPTKPLLTQELANLMTLQGVESKTLSQDMQVNGTTLKARSLVIPLDQPYSREADMLLDKQYYKSTDPGPYDDTGWTVGPLFNLDVQRISSASLEFMSVKSNTPKIDQKDHEADISRLAAGARKSNSKYLIVDPSSDPFLMIHVWRDGQGAQVAEQAFQVDKEKFAAGSLIVSVDAMSAALWNEVIGVGMHYLGANEPPSVPKHVLTKPRIMLLHDWESTEPEGWLRLALDHLGVQYKYTSIFELKNNPDLRKEADVIILGPDMSQDSIVNGRSTLGDPIPWKPLPGLPNLGGPDKADDIRGGCGLEGVMHLQKFLDNGGLLITMGSSSELPVYYSMVHGVTLSRDQSAPSGSVFLTERGDKVSPVLYGYGDTLGVYTADWYLPFRINVSFGGGRRFGGGGGGGERPSGRGDKNDADVVQGRPPFIEPKDSPAPDYTAPQWPKDKVLLRFASADKCLISGGYGDIKGIAGSPALVLCPVGKGNVLMFGLNPTWRGETVGSYQLLMNAIANWQSLQIDEPKEPEKKPDDKKAGL